MKTNKVYSSLDEIYNDAKPHQVDAIELLQGRSRIFEEWTAFEITDELREQIIERITEILGGREATKKRIKNNLRYGKPKHYTLGRMVLEVYSGKAKLVYIAGQSQPDEMREGRKALS